MRFRGTQFVLVLVFLILGVMLSVQFRVQETLKKNVPAQRDQQLVNRLVAAETDRDSLRDERDQLQREMEALQALLTERPPDPETEAGQAREALLALEGQLRHARMAAGLLPVHGPGLTVVLDDSKLPRRPGEDPNQFIIHDEDILRTLNELRDAGAEAISINGLRVLATTEIRCAGAVISINNERTAPPVRIQVIGDPAVLEAALRLRGGVLDSLAFFGIDASVERSDDLVVPAYRGSLTFRHAQLYEGGDV